MRPIDLDDLEVGSDWRREAEAALKEVREASEEERSKAIDKYSKLWGKLKEALAALSANKCWYCESVDPRSDNAVDHYRPKGNVKDARPPHGGYWWLAFDWKNYRFSCTYCNSIRKGAEGQTGGKQDYFPVQDESRRARRPDDDLEDEYPMLLDPTVDTDPVLLWFDDDGSAVPFHAREENELSHERARISIQRYHLNHPTIKEQRLARCKEIRRWVEEADRYLGQVERGKAQKREPAAQRMKDVRKARFWTQPYSAAVNCLLDGMRETFHVARLILSR